MTQHAPYGEEYDCQPTLDDQQVIEFCRQGYMMLEAVVDDKVNRKVLAYLDETKDSPEPTEIMQFDWFVDGVLMNAHAAGAIRSLLGANFQLPVIISNHHGRLPYAFGDDPGRGWHRDGGSVPGVELNYLQVFYYPQECRTEHGPTELLPGSHLMHIKTPMMANFGRIKDAVATTAPAGSIFITVYSIWHRRCRATARGTPDYPTRNLLKYNYFRTSPPKRDWAKSDDFDFSKAQFRPSNEGFEQFQGNYAASRLFCWLAGIDGEHRQIRGQSWPCVSTTKDGTEAPNMPQALRRVQSQS